MTSVTDQAGPGPLAGTAAPGQYALAAPTTPDGSGWVGRSDPSFAPAYGYPPGTYQPVYAEPSGRFANFLIRLWERSPRWLAPAAILTCFAGAAGYVLVSDPTDDGADAVSTCLVKLTTGFDCPGCGGTRAFYYLLRGNLPAAARHHLVFVFAVPFLVYLFAAWAGEQVFHKRLPKLRLPSIALGVSMAAWMVFSVLRNLPWAPFTWFYV